MRLADALLLGVLGVLACYAALSVVAFRRTRDPGSLLALIFAAYWSLVGAMYFLVAKRTSGGKFYTYIEERLFPVSIDGDYALVLLCYSAFLLALAVAFLVLSRPHRTGNRSAWAAWESLSQRFAHPYLLTAIGGMGVAKFFIVRELVSASGGRSLYEATRIVQGAMGRDLLIYQYLNIAASYSLAIGLALWVSFRTGRERYRTLSRAMIWAAYLGLFVGVIGENALLGNRAVPLVMMAGVAAGWTRWRFLPSSGKDRRALSILLVGLAVVALLGLGAIGSARGAGLSDPRAIAGSLAANLKDPANVLAQIGGSAEKVASHMSLVGVIRDDPGVRQPLAANSYETYASLVNAPADQGFTVHPAAAWWLRVGPSGVILAGLLIGVALAFFQRLSYSPRGGVASAFSLPAAVLPAAGIPVITLRNGPESAQAVVVELLVIPALICLPATLSGRTSRVAQSFVRQDLSITSSGTNAMNTPLTNDLVRAFLAVRQRWWIVAAAGLLGAGVGLAGASSDDTATYRAHVPLPPVSSATSTWYAPAAQLAASLETPQVRDQLGGVADNTALVSSVTPEPSASVEVRVTAPTAEQAEAATAAYAGIVVDGYETYMRRQLQDRLVAVDKGIEVLGRERGDRAVSALANLTVEQRYLQALTDQETPVPAPVAMTSGGSLLPTTILLAVAFAGLAAAGVGLLGLGSRRLRFSDDVTAVTGEGSLVASVPGEGSWAFGGLIERLAANSGQPVTLVPVGRRGLGDVRDALLVGVGDPSHVRLSPPVGPESAKSPTGPVLLIARLGVDTRRQLDSNHRAFTAANSRFVGVAALDARA